MALKAEVEEFFVPSDGPERERVELISEISPFLGSAAISTVLRLLEFHISVLRADNDNATRLNVLRNQGGIRALQEIIRFLEDKKSFR